MEQHLWDVVVPVALTALLLVLVFTIIVCKYKKCMNLGKDVALRRHRKLWMTCGSLSSEFPSRSTTEQSLYRQATTPDDPNRHPILVTDACVQTSQADYLTDGTRTAMLSQSPFKQIKSTSNQRNEQGKVFNYLESGVQITPQAAGALPLNMNKVLPSGHRQNYFPITTENSSVSGELPPTKTTTNFTIISTKSSCSENNNSCKSNNVQAAGTSERDYCDLTLHLKDISGNGRNRATSNCVWREGLVERSDDEGSGALSHQSDCTPLLSVDNNSSFYSAKSTELLLSPTK